MKRKIRNILIIVILVLFIVPSRFLDKQIGGNFNVFTGSYVCEKGRDCKHEEGHLEDSLCAPYTWMTWEWCSAQPKFRNLVDEIYSYQRTDLWVAKMITKFPGVGDNPRRFVWSGWTMLRGGWGGYNELYATLYKFKDEHISVIELLEGTLFSLSLSR